MISAWNSGPRQPQFLQLRVDDALALFDLFLPACAGFRGELFEGIDVVEINLLDLADGGVDVARDGDVDEKQGPIFAGAAGFFDDSGFPAGSGWEDITFPEITAENFYALEIAGESMLPVYRDGDRILVSP